MTSSNRDTSSGPKQGLGQSVFSKIIRGELPAYSVFEDEWVLAFLTRDPIHLGHSLIVPKVEVDSFLDVPEPHFSAVFRAAKPLGRAIQMATGCSRVGTLILGWDVPHFHYHLVPMYGPQDVNLSFAAPQTHEKNLEMQRKIQEALAKL